MRADDVGGHQVGRELYALRVELEYLRERGDEGGLAESGKAFEKDMPARENAGKDESVQRGTSEKHRVERRERAVEVCLYRRDFVGGEECHLDFLSVSKKRFTVARCLGDTVRLIEVPAERPPIAADAPR